MNVTDFVEGRERAPFLIDANSGSIWNYLDFFCAALSLAKKLRSLGAGPGTRIAAQLQNGPEFACFYFANLALGSVAVPVNMAYSKEDREYILMASQASILVCDKVTFQEVGLLANEDMQYLFLGDSHPNGVAFWDLHGDHGTPNLDIPIDPTRLFTLTFTSGTTGRPKGIFHSVETLFDNAKAFVQAMNVGERHRFYHVLPMAYMAGILNNLLCPFCAGASIVVDREFDSRMAFNFWEMPRKHNVNVMWLVPSILTILLKIDRGDQGERYAHKNLDFICVGTAPLLTSTKEAFEARYGVSLCPSYGLSETLIITIHRKGEAHSPGSSGRALESVKLAIWDDGGKRQPACAEGEVYISTPSLMIGYLNPETGEPELLDRGYAFPSGDIGIFNTRGELSITDRKKDLIIRGGLNVSPKKVEGVLEAHGDVDVAAVLGIPDAKAGEIVAAAIKLKPHADFETVKRELIDLCRVKLERPAWPEFYCAMNEFPTSSTGKLSKKDLLVKVCEVMKMQKNMG